jgi:hypothetical protein
LFECYITISEQSKPVSEHESYMSACYTKVAHCRGGGVCEDELINLQSTIIGIDRDWINISPKHAALKYEIPFQANELRK